MCIYIYSVYTCIYIYILYLYTSATLQGFSGVPEGVVGFGI